MDFSLCHFWNLKLRIYPTLWFCVIFLLSIIFWVKPEIFNLRYDWRWPKYITLASFYSSSTSAPPLLMASLRLSASDLSFALSGRILEASSNSIRAATMFPIFKEWIGLFVTMRMTKSSPVGERKPFEPWLPPLPPCFHQPGVNKMEYYEFGLWSF